MGYIGVPVIGVTTSGILGTIFRGLMVQEAEQRANDFLRRLVERVPNFGLIFVLVAFRTRGFESYDASVADFEESSAAVSLARSTLKSDRATIKFYTFPQARTNAELAAFYSNQTVVHILNNNLGRVTQSRKLTEAKQILNNLGNVIIVDGTRPLKANTVESALRDWLAGDKGDAYWERMKEEDTLVNVQINEDMIEDDAAEQKLIQKIVAEVVSAYVTKETPKPLTA